MIAGLQSQVHVVGHKTECMDPIAEAGYAFLEQFVEQLSIMRREEDVLLSITAQDHVIQAAGNMQARFSSHGVSNISQENRLCN